MTNNLAEYLHQIELKYSIPQDIKRLKTRELVINLYLLLFGVISIAVYFYSSIDFASNANSRLLLFFMLAWIYCQLEYKYFLASYDLSIQIKRSNSLQEVLHTD